ncbi:MAG: hypothetical protein HUJ72_12955, partial [Blautia sp.]|nr:hypothetical protein [Blautia sp.]
NAASDKSVPCYVRVRVSVSDSVFKNALKYIGMDQTNWVYSSSDDFYYYKPVLQPGACTTALFEQIQIISAKLDINDAINPSEFVMDVYEESVQADDFTDYQKAWTYYTTPISK